jgi:hypothetical protein
MKFPITVNVCTRLTQRESFATKITLLWSVRECGVDRGAVTPLYNTQKVDYENTHQRASLRSLLYFCFARSQGSIVLHYAQSNCSIIAGERCFQNPAGRPATMHCMQPASHVFSGCFLLRCWHTPSLRLVIMAFVMALASTSALATSQPRFEVVWNGPSAGKSFCMLCPCMHSTTSHLATVA